jgi:hypothetical protein
MRERLTRFGGTGLAWLGCLSVLWVLWAEPFYAFHHDYALGPFAWLLIGGEDGFHVILNPCGIVLNGIVSATVLWCAYAATLRLARWKLQNQLSNQGEVNVT